MEARALVSGPRSPAVNPRGGRPPEPLPTQLVLTPAGGGTRDVVLIVPLRTGQTMHARFTPSDLRAFASALVAVAGEADAAFDASVDADVDRLGAEYDALLAQRERERVAAEAKRGTGEPATPAIASLATLLER